jgi:hypothetical protein
VDAATLEDVMAKQNEKPLARGETAEMRAQGDAIRAMKEATGMFGPPPSAKEAALSKWMNLGGGRGKGRRMLAV